MAQRPIIPAGVEASPPAGARAIAAAKRAIAAVDVFVPVALLVALGTMVVAIVFRHQILVAVTLAFFWLVAVLALVAWYNFVAVRVDWPPLEIAGRERRFWRQPWGPPVVLAIGALIGILGWS